MNNKKISTKFAAAAAVALWMTACSENIETRSDDSTQNISIGVSVHQGWNDATPKKSAPQATRAAQSGEQQAVTKADGTIGQQDVFLWCDELNGISGKGLEVEVSASTQGDEATRGKLMTGTLGNDAANEKFHKTFSIYGEKSPGGRTATWRHDNEWSLSSSFTWGDFDTDNYDFYAIAPAADAAVSNASETGFTYTVPQNATNQHDLMVGLATAKRSDRHMWFDFNHALSAVKFKIGNDGFKSGFSFKKIEILGVARTNTYTFAKDSEGKEAGTWGTPTGTINVTSQMVGSGVGSLGGANTMITSDTDGTTFVLLPQTLSTDIQVKITLEDSNGETEINANLNLTGITEWRPGYSYIYTISSSSYPSDYNFTISGAELTFNHDGTPVGTNQFSITSYKKDTNTPTAWSIDGYMLQNEDGTWPDEWENSESTMLKSLEKASGIGSISPEEVGAEVFGQSPTNKRDVRRQDELRSSTRETRTNFDLSIHDLANSTAVIPRTTANSYIVRYAGTYKIPLVVGNAIQNGVAKKASDYTSTAETSVTFTNGSNVNIPWKYGYNAFRIHDGSILSTTNCKITGASEPYIVWHDFCDPDNSYAPLTVIKDLSISSGEDGLEFLNFTVDANNIQQGNAVLAVKKSGDVVWSWHIYITNTDWTQSSKITNYEGVDFNLSPENLGYVDEVTTTTYPERNMRIRVRQQESNGFAIVTIKQLPYVTRALHHWDTKYQWGRKDAFPGLDDSLTKYYTGTKTFGTYTSPYNTISSPFKWGNDQGNSSWYSEDCWMNLWSAQQTTVVWGNADVKAITTSVKTIYDPSPVGYKVPPAAAFTGTINDFTKTEWTFDGSASNPLTNKDKTNVVGEYDGEGWNFYCDGKSGKTPAEREARGTFFMPSTGMLNSNGKTLAGHMSGDLGWEGWEWGCVPRQNQSAESKYRAWNVSYRRNRVRALPNNSQSSGLAVRPVKE